LSERDLIHLLVETMVYGDDYFSGLTTIRIPG
jgi:hypothetical protein